MAEESTASESRASAPRPRRRNRHGRGARGNVLPPQLHARTSEALRFSQLLSTAMGQLPRPIIERLESVQVLSLNAPVDPAHLPRSDARAPLTGTYDQHRQQIMLYRWPILALARRQRRPVRDVLADCLAFELSRLWMMPPESIDPLFGLPRES